MAMIVHRSMKVRAAANLFAAALLLAGAAIARKPDLKAEAQAYADRKCLAEALYFEAISEGEAGMIAVAEVILRRTKSPGFGKTICKVVHDGAWARGCEFSYACDASRTGARSVAGWRTAWALAKRILADRKAIMAANTTKDALFFHADYVDPNWEETLGLEVTVQIGRHIFYKPAQP